MKSPLPSLFVLLLSLFLTAPLHAKQWADPSGFFDEEKIEKQELYPGVTWVAASGKLNGQPLRTQIVAADLARSDLSMKALVGEQFVNTDAGQFFRRSTTSQLQEDNQALAAINVAFFDIQNTQAPEGLTLREGIVLREPNSHRANFIYLPDGRATLANLGWEAQIRVGSQRRPLHGVNRPGLGGDEVVLYLPPWAQSPGASAGFTTNQKVREILVQKSRFEPASRSSERARLTGRILEVRDSGKPIEIKPDQFVLTASESAAPFFRNARAGAEVEVNWHLTGTPPGVDWHTLREVVSSGPFLVRGGKPEKGSGAFWDGRHPRSAVGISQDGRKVLLVVVDGRSDDSVGIGLGDLADYLIHLGAYEAMNFDGGGSSALAAQVDGKSRLLNQPSDARERYVPTGLGVVLVEQNLNEPRSWTGANGRTMNGLFQRYDPATKQVTLILDGRRFTFPLSSLSKADQSLILRAHPEEE